jgi:hypothetical protein
MKLYNIYPSAEKFFKIVNRVSEDITEITPYKYKILVVIFDNCFVVSNLYVLILL